MSGCFCCANTEPIHTISTDAKMNLLPLMVANNEYWHDTRWHDDAGRANNMECLMEEAPDALNYTDYRFICSHNSYTDPIFFKFIRQQDVTIIEQLMFGIRGINLDVYPWAPGVGPYELVGPDDAALALSHGAPGFVANVQKGTLKYQSLKYELRRIVEFMRANPETIVTLTFEDYAPKLTMVNEIKNVIARTNYDCIFGPGDLRDFNNGTRDDIVYNMWPTLGWMRKHNKRLIIFFQNYANSDITFGRWMYYTENQYGTVDPTAICALRGESHDDAPLVAFSNQKGTILSPSLCDTIPPNSYNTALQTTTHCSTLGFAGGRLFNVYGADRIVDSCRALRNMGEKTVFDYVNELNKNVNKKEEI